MDKQHLKMTGVEAMEAGVCAHLAELGLDLPPLEPAPVMRIASAFTEAQKLGHQILEAIERDDGTGICIGCRHEQGQCEPRARALACEACGEHKVYGVQELVLMGYAEPE